jgi:hypothetical protein
MRYSLGEKMPTTGWEDSQPVEASTGRDPFGWHAVVHVLPLGSGWHHIAGVNFVRLARLSGKLLG